jgi:hypothetical protein
MFPLSKDNFQCLLGYEMCICDIINELTALLLTSEEFSLLYSAVMITLFLMYSLSVSLLLLPTASKLALWLTQPPM